MPASLALPLTLWHKTKSMKSGNFFAELKRRNVYKVAVAYIVAGWALAQGIAQVFPVFNVPNWVVRLIVVLTIIGFPFALIFAWAFEITPEGLKRTEEADAMPASARPTSRTWIYIVVIGVVISAGLFFLGYTAGNRSTSPQKDKSIAVLPFQSLSEDKNDAYFADGVQDQILTNLAKVSDLKVISHTSVRQYETGAERNLREIGRQLGVAYIVEGSVQRVRDRLRINATLIDARTDAHVWAETYDRTAADLFAIQSDLAQSIVTQLKAKLSPKQKAEIEERPTQDLVAFELYLQAKAIIDSYINATDVRAALLQALKSLEEAIQRDPNFVSAYCYAARANDLLFFFDLDPTPERISLADAAVKTALRLRPDSAEPHFALADYLFRCKRDYDRAMEELAIARPGLPNSTPFFILSGYINRRRNHFHEAERDFSTAFALDPRNPNAYNLLADTYLLQRRFAEAVHVYDNVLAAGEQAPIVRFRRAASMLYGTCDTGPLREILAKFPDMEFAGGQTPGRAWMAMLDGNYAEAQHAIDLMPISKDIYDGALVLEGLAQVYAWSGDRDRAIELLQKLVTMPSYINYGRLKLHPLWSTLRGDPQFEKIVNSLAPK